MEVPDGFAEECGICSGSLAQAPCLKRIRQMIPKHTTKAAKDDRIITAIMLLVSPPFLFLGTSTPRGFIASP